MGLELRGLARYRARETDVNYGKYANMALNKAKWGMFCIPGIANIEDIKLLSD